VKFIDDWKAKLLKSEHLYAALFWGGMGGLIMVWPALEKFLTIWAFLIGGVAISAAFALAKLLHRPGTE
jgi:hypothetical protein